MPRLPPLLRPPKGVKHASRPSVPGSTRPPRPSRTGWPNVWSTSPTNGPSARSSTICATWPTSWPPPLTKPASRSAKKGVRRFQHHLPRLPRRCPLHQLLAQNPSDGQRRRRGAARLLPLRCLRQGPLPFRPSLRPASGPPQHRPATAGLPCRGAGFLPRRGGGSAAPPGRGASVGLHRAARHRTGRCATATATTARGRGRPAGVDRLGFHGAKHKHTAAYLGLDAFSVPIQGPGGKKAEGRMLYVGLLYTPDKKQTHYLVDFDLDQLAGQMRRAAIALGLSRADRVLAISDAGNGLEAALKRHFWDDLLCILDWYHATQHLHAFAGQLHPDDAGQRAAWVQQAKGILYEQGGTALVAWLRDLPVPAEAVV